MEKKSQPLYQTVISSQEAGLFPITLDTQGVSIYFFLFLQENVLWILITSTKYVFMEKYFLGVLSYQEIGNPMMICM